MYCLFHLSMIVIISPPQKVSSLGFKYEDYYSPMTTGPLHVKLPAVKWTTGPPELVRYMNDVYIPITKEGKDCIKEKHIIYQKRQSAGIAGQIIGVCDVLFLGMSHNRTVRSIICRIE